MTLTDCYIFEKLATSKAKARLDCIASTNSYDPFEVLRNKENVLFVYVGDNTYTKAGKEGKADLAMCKTVHISSIYTPDITLNLGWGDVNHTQDALLFVFSNFSMSNGVVCSGSSIEVYVARGYRANCQALFASFADGELDDEMERLKANAKNTLY